MALYVVRLFYHDPDLVADLEPGNREYDRRLSCAIRLLRGKSVAMAGHGPAPPNAQKRMTHQGGPAAHFEVRAGLTITIIGREPSGALLWKVGPVFPGYEFDDPRGLRRS
jgi:hypothetical protein